jgi:hypothetical protein
MRTVGDGQCEQAGRTTWARLGLASLLVGMVACLLVALTPDPNPPLVPPPGSTSDLDLFRRVVDDVRAGEHYHDACHHEELALGYPTRSVFNYRTPTCTWLLAIVPSVEWGQALLCLGVLVGVGLAGFDLLDEVHLVPAGVGTVFLVGATAWCCGRQTYLFTEVWAGMLILLSIVTLRRGWTAAGVATGVAAIFFRELSLPYVVVCMAIAAGNGRRREVRGWVIGLAAWAGFMAWHAHEIHLRLTALDMAIPGGWVRFGGLRFILSTAQANVFLMGLPLWCTALYVPPAVLGLATWTGEAGRRSGLTGVLYLTAFSIVGAPFNFYWGFVSAPLLALGLAHAPAALAALVHDAFPATAAARSGSGVPA